MVDTKGDWCMVGIIRADTSFSLSYPCYSIASDHQCTVLIWVMNCFFCHHKGAWGLYIKDVGFLWAVFDTPPPPCRNFDPDLPNFYLLIPCNIKIWFDWRLWINQKAFMYGAIHKRRRNILGGEGGLKFRCCKILEGRSWVNHGQNFDMGEEGIKNGQKSSDVFYGRPLQE